MAFSVRVSCVTWGQWGTEPHRPPAAVLKTTSGERCTEIKTSSRLVLQDELAVIGSFPNPAQGFSAEGLGGK